MEKSSFLKKEQKTFVSLSRFFPAAYSAEEKVLFFPPGGAPPFFNKRTPFFLSGTGYRAAWVDGAVDAKRSSSGTNASAPLRTPARVAVSAPTLVAMFSANGYCFDT